MDNFLILERLDRLERMITANKEVLTFEETWDYTGISRSYLYKLTAAGISRTQNPTENRSFSKRRKSFVGCSVTDAILRRKYRPKLRRRLRETPRNRFPVDRATTF